MDYNLRSPDVKEHHSIDIAEYNRIRTAGKTVRSAKSARQLLPTIVTHAYIANNAQRLQMRLVVTEDVMRHLWSVWEDSDGGYGQTPLTDLSDPKFRSKLPLPFASFQTLLERQVSVRIQRLKCNWHPAVVKLMDDFVDGLESPLMKLANTRANAKKKEGTQKVDFNDPDFHKWMLNMRDPSKSFTGPMHGMGNRRGDKLAAERKVKSLLFILLYAIVLSLKIICGEII